MLLKKPITALLLFVTGILLILAINEVSNSDSEKFPKNITYAEAKIGILQKELRGTLQKLSSAKSASAFADILQREDGLNQKFSFYFFTGDSLKFWNDNEPAITDSLLLTIKDGDFLRLANGDFLAQSERQGNNTSIGLLLLKHNYEYENKYLINDFNPLLGLSKNYVTGSEGIGFHIPDNAKHFYTLKPGTENYASALSNVIYSIAFILLFIAVYFMFRRCSNSLAQSIAFILMIIAVRFAMIIFKSPSNLYQHGVFSPALYASSFFFNSLGDFLINVSLLLIFSICLYERAGHNKKKAVVITTALYI